jgi:hypothetical protein
MPSANRGAGVEKNTATHGCGSLKTSAVHAARSAATGQRRASLVGEDLPVEPLSSANKSRAKSSPSSESKHIPREFRYGKKGLWEKWFEYPPEPDWVPADVYERVRCCRIQHRTYWYVSKVVKGEFINNKVPLPIIPPVVAQQMLLPRPQVAQPDPAEECSPTEIESDDDDAVIPGLPSPTESELSGCSASPTMLADVSSASVLARPVDIMDVTLRCIAERTFHNKKDECFTVSGFARPIDIMDVPLLW